MRAFTTRLPRYGIAAAAGLILVLGYFLPRYGPSADSRHELATEERPAARQTEHRNRNVGAPHRAGSQPPLDLKQLNLSPEDWRITKELNERQAAGEYVRRLEKPVTRKWVTHDFDNIAQDAMARNAPGYNTMFAELGISTEDSRRLQGHLAQIQKASLETEVAIQDLEQARIDYDTRIRSLLGADDYQKYREFEGNKRSIQQFENFRAFVDKTGGMSLDPKFDHAVTDVIRRAEAYSDVMWHGPYDGLPLPAMGKEKVIRRLEEDIHGLTDGMRNAVSLLPEANLPDEYRSAFVNYYSERLGKKTRMLESVRAGKPARIPMQAEAGRTQSIPPQ